MCVYSARLDGRTDFCAMERENGVPGPDDVHSVTVVPCARRDKVIRNTIGWRRYGGHDCHCRNG